MLDSHFYPLDPFVCINCYLFHWKEDDFPLCLLNLKWVKVSYLEAINTMNVWVSESLVCDALQASIKTIECNVLARNNASAIHQEMCLGRAEESGAGFSEDNSRELRVIWQGDVHLTNEMNHELYASCAQLVMLVRVMCFSAGIGPILLWRIHYSSWHPWEAGVFSWDTTVMQLPGVSAPE